MVFFTRKRLQVFVSSTYTDLVSPRQAAVEAILTAGHMPAGMELFTSGDESQMEVIKQWIDESDVFLLILGGRYGSLEPSTGKSYTQLEYEYASDLQKPLFACVIDEGAIEERVKQEGTLVIETKHPKELENFRNLVLSKLVRFWSDEKDIKIAIGETLLQLSRSEDLVGWVRADTEVNAPALADEIARLSLENSQLRSQLSVQNKSEAMGGLSYSEMLSMLERKKLLNPFIENREFYAGQFEFNAPKMEREEFIELCVLGLFEETSNTSNTSLSSSDYLHILSEFGRGFLNKYTLNELGSEE